MPDPQPSFDYRKFAVLYVDDEETSLRSFARAFGDDFRVLTAPTAQEGLHLLNSNPGEVALLLTDQRMPGEKGTWLLEQTRQHHPHVLRILVTAFADMDATIQAVNTGAIYKYVHKPWNPPQLETLIRRALEFFSLQRERDQLLREKTSILHHLMIADRLLSLGLLSAGLSHHIRNALVSVKTFVDLAPAKLQAEGIDLRQLRHPDFWQDYYGNVQGQLDKINTLLKDLWLASERPSFEFRDRVSLREVVEMAFDRFRPAFAQKNITLENTVPADLPHLTVDHTRFNRLFELLFEDELVSLPEKSHVRIRACPTLEKPDQPSIRIEVEDDGPGLPKEVLESIFGPFVPRSDSPSEYGIRLMACFFIVHQHGGRIIARSTEGRGTTFILRLPTNPSLIPLAEENQSFLQKLFFTEEAWEKYSHPPTAP